MSDTDSSAFDSDVDFDIPGFDAPKAEGEDTSKLVATNEGSMSLEDAKNAPEAAEAEVEAEEVEKVVEAKPETPAARKLKFMAGDKALELDETAKVDWKVDGKTVQVSARELLDNYAGKTSYERKFNDLAAQRKLVETRDREVASQQESRRKLITDVYEKVKSGKAFDAVASLVELTGVKMDPREYVKSVREAFIEQAKQMATMTDEQRQLFEAKEERDYVQSQYARLNQQREAEQAQVALQQRMATVAETNKIPFDEFAQTYEWLKQQAAQHGEAAKVTPEYVVQHRRELQAYEVARDAIAAIEPALLSGNVITDEARWDKLAALVKAHPDVTREEFIEMYKSQKQGAQAKKVAAKIKSSPVSTAAGGQVRAAKKPADTSATDFNTFTAEDLRF